jgi:hypothetical protein
MATIIIISSTGRILVIVTVIAKGAPAQTFQGLPSQACKVSSSSSDLLDVAATVVVDADPQHAEFVQGIPQDPSPTVVAAAAVPWRRRRRREGGDPPQILQREARKCRRRAIIARRGSGGEAAAEEGEGDGRDEVAK